MSAGKPMTYVSLRCILYYLEANQRFLIARCCPSIEKLDKSVPLKIQNLIFSSEILTINRAHYELSVFSEALGEGIESKYGVESDEDNKLVNYNYSYLNSTKPGTSNTDFFDSEEELAENTGWEALRNVMDRSSRVNVSQHIHIECWYCDLQPEIRIEKVAYNKSLAEARDYLANKLLSGRIVHVDSLFILDDEECMPPIPSKAKLTVAHLREIKNEESFSAVRSILDETPLESVYLLEAPERFNDPLISTAKKVIVNGYASVLLEIGSEIPRVHVVGIENAQEDLAYLLSHFTAEGRPPGTFYSVEIYGSWRYESLFEEIKNIKDAKIIKLEEARRYSGYAILPVIGGSELHVHCVPFKGGGVGGCVATVNFHFY